ncbi:MAG: Gfo/Idh/MocA family oxidoreductase [Pseudomonadota bacterium]
MKTISVGVIGAGYLGRFHALIYSRLPGVRLVGVVDVNPESARRVAEEAGTRAFTDPSALLGQVDAVSVVVPTSLHLAVARPFLEIGVPLLIEKPLAANREEGTEILRLARASHTMIQVGHVERFNAGVMALAARIHQPRFIEAQRMGGFVDRATDVDVVSDLMIHDIDIVLSLVDAEITHLSAIGTPVLTDHIDIANARLEFANGAVANVVASRVSDTQVRRIRVFEENAYLSLDFIDQRLDIARPRPRPGERWPEIVRERVEIVPVKPLDAELEAFIQCVRTGAPPLVDGAVGLRALEVALQVKDCILAGGGGDD